MKARLRGAKVDGFDGVKVMELKLNRKLKQRGMSPVRLQEECADDLEQRTHDQYKLFKEIVKLYAPPVIQAANYTSMPAQAAYSPVMQQFLS